MIVTSLVVIALGVSLDFTSLADTSNVAVVLQYISTCASVIVMRRRSQGPKSRFHLPLGPTVPLMAIAGSVAFLMSVARKELMLAAALLGGGMAIGVTTRWIRRQ